MIDISVVTVNYNVKEYVSQLITSLFNAEGKLKIEIFVVDNGSYDGSIPFLKKKFGNKIDLIPSGENLGFGKANNLTLDKIKGKYTLLINPDAVVEEDTLEILYEFMESHPDAAMAGCKILNPDGTYAPESKRAIPKPATALWKMIGFDKLFPDSSRFREYYVPWVGENETAEVPAISGSFMFIRSDNFKKIGGFDPQFFMYGEDLDLCLRIREEGGKIYYVPETSIIHYKGESTKKEQFDYTWHFYNAMYLFFKKHYKGKINFLVRYLVQLGIILRGAMAMVKNFLSRYSGSIIDIFLINLLLAASFIIRFSVHNDFTAFRYREGFLAIHLFITVFFLFFSRISISYRSEYKRLAPAVKSLTLSFLTLATVTFFIKDLAFSRLVVGFTYLTSLAALILWRLPARRSGRRGKDSGQLRVILAGVNPEKKEDAENTVRRLGKDYRITGLVIAEEKTFESEIAAIPVAGTIADLPELIVHQKPDMVIFLAGEISYRQIIQNMRSAAEIGVTFKIIPENLNLMIGKSAVEDLDAYTVMNFELPYWKSHYQLFRRWIDMALGIFFMILLSPVWLWLRITRRKKTDILKINYGRSSSVEISYLPEKSFDGFANFVLFLPAIINGKMGFVGAKYYPERTSYFIKIGLTGPARTNKNDDYLKAELAYLKNYTIWTDLKFLFRYLSGRPERELQRERRFRG